MFGFRLKMVLFEPLFETCTEKIETQCIHKIHFLLWWQTMQKRCTRHEMLFCSTYVSKIRWVSLMPATKKLKHSGVVYTTISVSDYSHLRKGKALGSLAPQWKWIFFFFFLNGLKWNQNVSQRWTLIVWTSTPNIFYTDNEFLVITIRLCWI